jgi:hypothetical protein
MIFEEKSNFFFCLINFLLYVNFIFEGFPSKFIVEIYSDPASAFSVGRISSMISFRAFSP